MLEDRRGLKSTIPYLTMTHISGGFRDFYQSSRSTSDYCCPEMHVELR